MRVTLPHIWRQYCQASLSVNLLDINSAEVSYGKPRHLIRSDRRVDLIESKQEPQATQATILDSSCRLGDPQMTAKAKKYY